MFACMMRSEAITSCMQAESRGDIAAESMTGRAVPCPAHAGVLGFCHADACQHSPDAACTRPGSCHGPCSDLDHALYACLDLCLHTRPCLCLSAGLCPDLWNADPSAGPCRDPGFGLRLTQARDGVCCLACVPWLDRVLPVQGDQPPWPCRDHLPCQICHGDCCELWLRGPCCLLCALRAGGRDLGRRDPLCQAGCVICVRLGRDGELCHRVPCLCLCPARGLRAYPARWQRPWREPCPCCCQLVGQLQLVLHLDPAEALRLPGGWLAVAQVQQAGRPGPWLPGCAGISEVGCSYYLPLACCAFWHHPCIQTKQPCKSLSSVDSRTQQRH